MERIEPGSIVVAVDGSEHAQRAVRWAADQASLEDRRLLVVSAGEGAQVRAAADREAGVATTLHPELSVEAISIPGDARTVLVELSTQAHLMVVGSRGRGMFTSAMLGSVSADVIARAGCPVVVCRPGGEGATRGILAGADGTAESSSVIEFAYRQAALRGLPLTILHCFWDAVVAVADYRRSRGEVIDSPELSELTSLLSETVARLGVSERYPDVPVTIGLRHGLVDEALTARSEAWDMIVVGRHPMNSLSRALTGSIATSVVERARTTVAMVPQSAPSADLES